MENPDRSWMLREQPRGVREEGSKYDQAYQEQLELLDFTIQHHREQLLAGLASLCQARTYNFGNQIHCTRGLELTVSVWAGHAIKDRIRRQLCNRWRNMIVARHELRYGHGIVVEHDELRDWLLTQGWRQQDGDDYYHLVPDVEHVCMKGCPHILTCSISRVMNWS